MNITKEAVEAFYSKAEVTRHGTILHIEEALTAAYAALPAGVGVETVPPSQNFGGSNDGE